jgi:uncharacterized membrane protein YeaQ/YmgE (transglycosylase-associated protein family)
MPQSDLITETNSQVEKLCIKCQKGLPMAAEFCPFCRSPQWQPAQQGDTTLGLHSTLLISNVNSSPDWAKGLPYIEFRASDNIWDIEEDEPAEYKQPRTRRPLRIIDEQSVFLAQTDKHITSEELLERVKNIIESQGVPVDVYLAQARWVNDLDEVRPRIVASLKNHSYSDVKMIMGLDYLGNWATFNMQVGAQPDPIPEPITPPRTSDTSPYVLMIVMGVIGAFVGGLMFLSGLAKSQFSNDSSLTILGFVIGGGGVALAIAGYINLQNVQQADKMNQGFALKKENEQYVKMMRKAMEKFSRTFKVDDIRLFSTAMRNVFEEVVDDIVERGGTVVREQGGHGGYFEDSSKLVQRKTDAAQIDI